MAELEKNKFDGAGSNDKANKHVNIQQKRKSDAAFDDEDTEHVNKYGKEDVEQDRGDGRKTGASKGVPVKKVPGISMNIGGPKISMNIGGPKKVAPVKMAMPSQDKKETKAVLPKSKKVASVFNEDSESDEEEMPPEAKMRMRNVGRETPTAAGPNSFGKGNLGFCDRTKMIERDLKRQMEKYGENADTS